MAQGARLKAQRKIKKGSGCKAHGAGFFIFNPEP